MLFEQFELNHKVCEGIKRVGFVETTPIQEEAIPKILAGRDIVGLAQTGTGKTAAFVIPILQRILEEGPRRKVRALIIAPTRELAEQTNQAVIDLCNHTRIKSLTLYGGVSMGHQVNTLHSGVEIVVACPGRLLDHMRRRTINLSNLEILVIDEADRLFDMGFLPDIRDITRNIPRNRQTMLFSATMPSMIRHLADDILSDPLTVQIDIAKPAETVSHLLYPVKTHLKTKLMLELLTTKDMNSVLVFTKTKHAAIVLSAQMEKAGFSVACLQGDMPQNRRDRALQGFRDGKHKILVATDLAARGLDVLSISHVINYDIPDTPDTYIHRIGRTGRADQSGDAFTLITMADEAMVAQIESVIGEKLKRRVLSEYAYPQPGSGRKARRGKFGRMIRSR
jgi:ATP-dependent RNA helicase RhlE